MSSNERRYEDAKPGTRAATGRVARRCGDSAHQHGHPTVARAVQAGAQHRLWLREAIHGVENPQPPLTEFRPSGTKGRCAAHWVSSLPRYWSEGDSEWRSVFG